MASSLPALIQKSFRWWQCSERYIISLFPHLQTPSPLPPIPNKPYGFCELTSMFSTKHHVYLLNSSSMIWMFPYDLRFLERLIILHSHSQVDKEADTNRHEHKQVLWLFCCVQQGVGTMQLSRQQGHHWWLETWPTVLTIGCLVVSIMRSSLVARYLTYSADHWLSCCVHHEVIIGG